MIAPDEIWEYKGVLYRVIRIDAKLRKQHPVTGQWGSTVIYTTLAPNPDGFDFVRNVREFEEKFTKVQT